MKLKKLIVSGFKSFADRVEFDFDAGVSCIVGPNGCGKSNVVDAIKWVLGEQSAKSLRGSEMMDVIFNGSSARKAAGGAEVTLLFDNSSGLLKPIIPVEMPADGSLAITRRLFRSGQSEYLLNKTSCRLRDIREMFMDTGVDAYSVIEQGRVEGFLQASPDDRRAVFDEAAGISKYKARKKEALRKLERVEQNLLRINDVAQEVEKRLRSIKYQAGKARNYQSYTERLKELRSLHLLAQYHTLSQMRTDLQARLDAGVDILSSIHAKIEQFESARSSTEAESADLERTARELNSRLASFTAQITACVERSEMLAGRVKELGEAIVAASARGEELEAKIASFAATHQSRRGEMEQIETQVTELGSRYETVRAEHHNGELEITQLQAALEDEKAGAMDLLRRTSQLHNEIHGWSIRRENLSGQQDRLTGRREQIEQSLQQALADRSGYQIKQEEIRQVLAEAQGRLDQAKEDSRRVHNSEQELRGKLGEAREQRSAVGSRMGALREMQQRLEGVSSGVRRVLEARKKGRLASVKGILADFLQTDVQHAPVVEAALAGADQHLVVDSLADLQACADELNNVLGEKGAVEALCLDGLGSLVCDLDLSGYPQVLGRVLDWMKFDSFLAPSMWRLLGRTLVVQSLSDAAAVRRRLAGYRLVTLQGEVLETDGRVRIGAGARSAGVITRRSELAELEARQAQLDQAIAALEQNCQTTRSEREHLEELQQKLRTAIYEANTERVECEGKLRQYNEQIEKLEREKPLVHRDLMALAEEIDKSVRSEHEARHKAAELEKLNLERQQQVERLTEEIAVARRRQTELSSRMMEVKVALAQAEEKKRGIRDSLIALQRQQEQMEQDLSAARSQIELDRQRRSDAESAIATARDEAQRLTQQKQALAEELEEVEESRRSLVERLEEVRRQMGDLRKSHDAQAAALNGIRVEASEADVRIENVISRATEEMGMDLLECFRSYQHDGERDWPAVEEEIKDLRSKIERLGNVNLDSIAEQDELEKREEFLKTQLADITASQNQLSELIRKINKESRQMFIDTFESVRKNFQELFRKLFGGGKADIILADPEDVLESQIDIVARPPGKETKSLLLLSGGEKTMTALSLLFSIFKSRPSPFCLLDEVDAALDEANTERFSRLLQEFIGYSQFLVISHAKRTMAMANVLYGVTMQEPGVSTRISVRFEDVGNKLDENLEPVGAAN